MKSHINESYECYEYFKKKTSATDVPAYVKEREAKNSKSENKVYQHKNKRPL